MNRLHFFVKETIYMAQPIRMTIVLLILSLSMSPFIPGSYANPSETQAIAIHIPAKTIANVINDALPIQLTQGETLSGLWIDSVENLILGKNKASISLKITGKDVKYTAKIGNQEVGLKVGELNIPIACDAFLRYDKQKKILFIKPQFRQNFVRNQSSDMADVAVQLLTLANGHEYPLEMRNIKPIMTQICNQALKINFELSDIYTSSGMLYISVIPSVTPK